MAGGLHEVDGVEALQVGGGGQSWRGRQRGMWRACIFTPKDCELDPVSPLRDGVMKLCSRRTNE